MTLKQCNYLHIFLERRKAPVVREDFAGRIITASRIVVQRRNMTVSLWLKHVFMDLRLPPPVYALTSILVIGFMAGLSLQSLEAGNITNMPNIIFDEELSYE